jgi:phosphoglycolate phosphatase-like HAD superfamily hydrolase
MRAVWVVLDWSGTLSPGAVAFGEPETLRRALQEAGLPLQDPERFWAEVVVPTWPEGSTTSIGYARLIARQLARREGKEAEEGYLEAARRFVQMYLEASAPDAGWKSILDLLLHHAVRLLVATDHYAEATEAFARHLQAWGYGVEVLRPQASPAVAEARNVIRLANSADLGAPKDSPRFWARLRRLLPDRPARVWVIDDFGANERAEDPYTREAQRRQQRMLEAIAQSWRVPVEGFAFGVPELGRDPAAARIAYRARLEEARRWLEVRLRLHGGYPKGLAR